MDFLVDTNTVQAKELEQLQLEVDALEKRKSIGDTTSNSRNQEVCPNYAAVGRSARHKKGICLFGPKNMTNRKEWVRNLMDDKSVKCKNNEWQRGTEKIVVKNKNCIQTNHSSYASI